MAGSGREAVLEVLRTEGVRHLFGNPGTTELPLMDALAGVDDLHYVLALQEATAVAMADGYAQVTRRPAFLSLHTSAGLGNAIGNLTNAQANQTPLVVTAGQQDYRHIEADPLLAGDLVGLARPVARWAHEVRSRRELATMLRRAFHDATAPPPGPVFVSLPMSTLEEEGDTPVPAVSRIGRATVADHLDELAELLTTGGAGRVAIVAGDEVAASGAHAELAAVAEALGAPVFGSPLHSAGVFPPAHPLWAGMLAPAAATIRATLGPFERVLLVGGRAFMVYPFTDGSPLPDGCELLHLSPDPLQVGRTYAARLGITGDPKRTLAALLPMVVERADAGAAKDAVEAARQRRRAEIDALERQAAGRYGPAPMDPMAAAHAVVRAMPDGTAVVDEAITTGVYVRGFHHWTEPGRYFFCKGGGLGWGMPAALGVSLAYDRSVPVLAAVGDGSAMYSPQALWTAARERLPVVFAVFVNRQYLILTRALQAMKGDSVRHDRFVAMTLDDPPIDYVALAASMGVAGTRVSATGDIGDAVRGALGSGRPHLLEIAIHVTVRPALVLHAVTYAPGERVILDNIDWVVRPDERWVVLGRNGSGKTTIIRLAAGRLHPTRGHVEILGQPLGHTDVRELRPRIGLASAALLKQLRPGLLALDAVMTARYAALEAWWHTYTDADRAWALALLERFGVAHVAGQEIATLSSGEGQRVMLARTLMTDPGLVLLDEPTAGLDLGGREELLASLAALARDPAAPPLVLVTHHVDEIPPGFTHALLLRAGRVHATGPVAEVLTADQLSSCFGLPLRLERRGDRWSGWAE